MALAQILLVSPFSNFPESDFWDFTWFVFAVMFASVGTSLASVTLIAVAMWEILRKPTPPAASEERIAKEFRFVHVAVLVHAVAVLTTMQTALNGGLMPPSVFWTTLSGAALILAMLNRLRWDARLALVGAAVSVATFGCAVWFAPTIYGRDLLPSGWYAILAAAVPVLAFLVVFLRRAPIFRRRPPRYGLAAALFIALACAVGFHMASSPNNKFSERLQSALDDRPSEIRFAELTGFEWDEVDLYGPGASINDFSPAAREGVDIVSRLSIRVDNESADLAVSVKNGETVYYELVRYDRHWFRLPPESGGKVVLKPEDAVFNVEHRPDGYRVLTLAD